MWLGLENFGSGNSNPIRTFQMQRLLFSVQLLHLSVSVCLIPTLMDLLIPSAYTEAAMENTKLLISQDQAPKQTQLFLSQFPKFSGKNSDCSRLGQVTSLESIKCDHQNGISLQVICNVQRTSYRGKKKKKNERKRTIGVVMQAHTHKHTPTRINLQITAQRSL